MKYVKVFYEAMLIFFRKHYPHYSSGYSVMIRAAVIARAGGVILKRIIVKSLKQLMSHRMKLSSKWIIISEQTNEIIDILAENILYSSAVILNNLSVSCGYDIIIDNSKFTYKEIIGIMRCMLKKTSTFISIQMRTS